MVGSDSIHRRIVAETEAKLLHQDYDEIGGFLIPNGFDSNGVLLEVARKLHTLDVRKVKKRPEEFVPGVSRLGFYALSCVNLNPKEYVHEDELYPDTFLVDESGINDAHVLTVDFPAGYTISRPPGNGLVALFGETDEGLQWVEAQMVSPSRKKIVDAVGQRTLQLVKTPRSPSVSGGRAGYRLMGRGPGRLDG